MIYGKKMNFLLCGVNALALTPAVASAKPAENKNADNRPNVLLIAIDDMKPWIGPYGDKLAKTLPQRQASSNKATPPNLFE